MTPEEESPLGAVTPEGARDRPSEGKIEREASFDAVAVKDVAGRDEARGGREAGCGRGAPAPAPAALPCLNRNNSIQPPPKKIPHYRFQQIGNTQFKRDREGVIWTVEDSSEVGGHHVRLTGEPLTGADRKRAFILRRHVEAFVEFWGREHTLFFTTTDGQGLSPRAYARNWNSLLANEGHWLRGYVRVLEPQKNGRPHFHNLAAVEFDTKPDEFNWEAFTAANLAFRVKDWATFRKNRELYRASAVPELVELWRWGREKMPLYGLGRCEILPVRKKGAIAEYIGKYLDKGMGHRIDAWKGVRRFETDRRTSDQWKRCGSKFSWVSPGAAQWRNRCRMLAEALGIGDTGDCRDISRKLGARWAYSMRGAMITGTDEEFFDRCAELRTTLGHFVGGGPF